MDQKRPSLDEYFMKISETVSERSTCFRHKFGAILVRNKRILSTGYNENPSGMKHCFELPEGCIRDEQNIPSGTRLEICTAVHAEQNAIIQCALHGIPSRDSTLYVTGTPCRICSRMIVNAGIREVVYLENIYPDEGLDILKQGGVILKAFKED